MPQGSDNVKINVILTRNDVRKFLKPDQTNKNRFKFRVRVLHEITAANKYAGRQRLDVMINVVL